MVWCSALAGPVQKECVATSAVAAVANRAMSVIDVPPVNGISKPI
jgi:hypothetical protein